MLRELRLVKRRRASRQTLVLHLAKRRLSGFRGSWWWVGWFGLGTATLTRGLTNRHLYFNDSGDTSRKRPTREQLIELAKSDPEAIADLVLMLWDRVEALEAKVAQLERNSRTSSKPPSSDSGNFTNPPKPKSLRRKSGRKPGGQKGRRGDTLEQVADPDHVVEHRLGEKDHCPKCGAAF